jgi:hypothetical protein
MIIRGGKFSPCRFFAKSAVENSPPSIDIKTMSINHIDYISMRRELRANHDITNYLSISYITNLAPL